MMCWDCLIIPIAIVGLIFILGGFAWIGWKLAECFRGY